MTARRAWAATVAVIVLLSVFGRSVQEPFSAALGPGLVPWVIGILVGVGGFAGGLWLLRSIGGFGVLHLVAILLLSIVVPLGVPTPEERIHFLLFGVFGFLTQRSFGSAPGVLVVLVGAVGDEILQGFVPGRFADARDVWVNGFSGFVGLAVGARGAVRPAAIR